MRSSRTTLIAAATSVLAGLAALAWFLVVPALEVRTYERDVMRRLAPVISCSGVDGCGAEATGQRVARFRADLADDEVSERLAPLHQAYLEQFETEQAFWYQAEGTAPDGNSARVGARTIAAAAERTRAVARDVGGPLYPLVS